jgi:hypothetical protein
VPVIVSDARHDVRACRRGVQCKRAAARANRQRRDSPESIGVRSVAGLVTGAAWRQQARAGVVLGGGWRDGWAVCSWAPAGWAVAEWLLTWRLTLPLRSKHTNAVTMHPSCPLARIGVCSQRRVLATSGAARTASVGPDQRHVEQHGVAAAAFLLPLYSLVPHDDEAAVRAAHAADRGVTRLLPSSLPPVVPSSASDSASRTS